MRMRDPLDSTFNLKAEYGERIHTGKRHDSFIQATAPTHGDTSLA